VVEKPVVPPAEIAAMAEALFPIDWPKTIETGQ
jgi:hypothetical protein